MFGVLASAGCIRCSVRPVTGNMAGNPAFGQTVESQPRLYTSPASPFSVQCSMFDVRCFPLKPSTRILSPLKLKIQNSKLKT
jgi:hypothetical protein